MDNVYFDLENIKVRSGEEYYPVCPFPIGFIYMSTKNINPARIYGNTWVQIDDGNFWKPSNSYGTVGGSTIITTDNLPSHSHTGTTNKDGGHNHTVTATINANGAHAHTPGASTASRVQGFACFHNDSANNLILVSYKVNSSGATKAQVLGWDYTKYPNGHAFGNNTTNSAGSHSHTISNGKAWSGNGTTDEVSQHIHAFTTNKTGSGKAYNQPYRTCYCWIRTA